MLKALTFGKKKPFLGEFTTRHPQDRNIELLWHCGPFPLSQKAESGVDSTARLVNQRSWFRGKDGTYTVARIDQESGNYMILPLVCHTTEGPQTHGTYIWGEFEDLQSVEDRIIERFKNGEGSQGETIDLDDDFDVSVADLENE